MVKKDKYEVHKPDILVKGVEYGTVINNIVPGDGVNLLLELKPKLSCLPQKKLSNLEIALLQNMPSESNQSREDKIIIYGFEVPLEWINENKYPGATISYIKEGKVYKKFEV